MTPKGSVDPYFPDYLLKDLAQTLKKVHKQRASRATGMVNHETGQKQRKKELVESAVQWTGTGIGEDIRPCVVAPVTKPKETEKTW